MKHFFVFICLAWFVLVGPGLTPAYAVGPLTPYVVQPGDTLYTIALRHGVSVNDLVAANDLGANFWVYPGQQLVIPTLASAPPLISHPYSIRPAVMSGDWVYTVRPGDTLFNIAVAHGTTVEALQAANQLFDYQAIYAGQPLVIPTSPSWASEPMTLPHTSPDNPNLRPGNWPNPFPPAPLFQRFSPPGRATSFGEKWIDVDLTRQALTAYEGQAPVFNSRVSSGIWQYPTVVGTFQIYVKYEVADMSGGSGEDTYYLSNVPYVMYFHGNYGLHGTYWHNNFGTPMSHGCVNLPTPAAEWLFHWAPMGTK